MTQWYEFGTASVSAAGSTVTLSTGALALANVKQGDAIVFKGTSFPPVEILAIPTNTTLTLRSAWPYAAQTNIAYAIVPGPSWNSTSDLARDVSEYLAAVSGVQNSDTSNTVGTGSKTWNVQPNLRVSVGARLRISDIAAPTTRYMEGVVTSYAGRALTLAIDSAVGTGSAALWNINFAGSQGLVGQSGRQSITANRTYYVRAGGNDSNNGLSDANNGAFLTLQKAVDVVAGLDIAAAVVVTIQVSDGTYSNVNLLPLTGAGSAVLQGDIATPANVIITTPGSYSGCVNALSQNVTSWTVRGFKFTGSGVPNNNGLRLIGASIKVSNIELGAGLHTSMFIDRGLCQQIGPLTLSAPCTYCIVLNGGKISAAGQTWTLVGTPSFLYFIINDGGRGDLWSMTFSGTGTGTRYNCSLGGMIQTYGAGATYLPGSIAGGVTSGGQYV